MHSFILFHLAFSRCFFFFFSTSIAFSAVICLLHRFFLVLSFAFFLSILLYVLDIIRDIIVYSVGFTHYTFCRDRKEIDVLSYFFFLLFVNIGFSSVSSRLKRRQRADLSVLHISRFLFTKSGVRAVVFQDRTLYGEKQNKNVNDNGEMDDKYPYYYISNDEQQINNIQTPI